jgi:hypothetical protein
MMTHFCSSRSDVDPSSGFLLTLHVLMWTNFTLGLIAILTVFMIT